MFFSWLSLKRTENGLCFWKLVFFFLENQVERIKRVAPARLGFREKRRTEFSKSKAHFSFFGESHEKNKRNYVLPFLVEFQAIIVLSNFKQNLQNLKTMKKTWKLLKKHENYEKNKNSFQKIVFRFLLLSLSVRTINFLVRSFCYTFQFFLSVYMIESFRLARSLIKTSWCHQS